MPALFRDRNNPLKTGFNPPFIGQVRREERGSFLHYIKPLDKLLSLGPLTQIAILNVHIKHGERIYNTVLAKN